MVIIYEYHGILTWCDCSKEQQYVSVDTKAKILINIYPFSKKIRISKLDAHFHYNSTIRL
jgi:hypothetical protein